MINQQITFMNKKAIWVIIGLMSMALLGITLLQINLIISAVKLKEDQFKQNIFDALYTVAEELEEQEYLEVRTRYSSGYARRYYEREGDREILALYLNRDFGEYTSAVNANTGILDPQSYSDLVLHRLKNGFENKPLVKRINLEQLHGLIYQKLSDKGITTDFTYGVYATEKKCFVIMDGHYLVEEPSPKGFLPSQENLYNSDYKVHLFANGEVAPGHLMAFFPNAQVFLWSQVWLNIIGSVIFTLIIMFCFAYTITVIFEQKKLSEMKTDFINNMTHEFKTPIATISLAADSITSPMIAGKIEKVQRFANIIKQENARMNSQVEKVLQMALLDKNDFKLKLTSVNLHEVIQQALENINLQVEKREGRAIANLKATQHIVEGDLTHISNIINNLLDNANKYSPEQPEITVHSKNVSNGVEISVQDKGIGMTKEARKQIFDKFYRVHTGDLHDVKGFGLGLSYVKAMMTAHKGTIDVKSELGKGSTFILFFPFYVHHD